MGLFSSWKISWGPSLPSFYNCLLRWQLQAPGCCSQFFFFYFLVVLEFELRASRLLGRLLSALFCVGSFQDRVSWTICFELPPPSLCLRRCSSTLLSDGYKIGVPTLLASVPVTADSLGWLSTQGSNTIEKNLLKRWTGQGRGKAKSAQASLRTPPHRECYVLRDPKASWRVQFKRFYRA
jgi:hypothetical protein